MKSKKALTFISRELNRVACLFSKPKKAVVFECFRGKRYADNPKAISEKMHELYPEYDLIWGFTEKIIPTINVPEYVKVYKISSWKYRRAKASAIAFVRNEAMTEDLYKRKGQLFIQTWHGDRGFKEILYDAWKKSKRPMRVMDEKLTDLFVLGSDYAEERIKSAFHYHGRTIKTGCPRNDCLIFPQGLAKIKAQLGIDPGKKILLYAPTLRDHSAIINGTLDITDTLQHLNNRGGEWICLVRAHPKALGLNTDEGENIIDVSKYPDMSDLLMIADALITDYSSCAGDFILRKKPVILIQYDRKEYGRDFHVDIEETGFLIAKNQQELDQYIDQLSDEEFAKNCEIVMKYFGVQETGHASENICRIIDKYCNKRII